MSGAAAGSGAGAPASPVAAAVTAASTAANAAAAAAGASAAPSAVTSALGYLVSLGGTVVKLPQLYSIVRDKSVNGLALSLFGLETVTCTVQALYAYRQRLAFASYGENVGIGLCDAVVLWGFYRFSPDAKERSAVRLFGFPLYPALVIALWRSPKLLALCQSLTIPLYIISRVPQIHANYSSGHTGQLSGVTFFANMCGSIVRLMDSKIRADPLLVTSFLISIALNATLVMQIARYRHTTARVNAAARQAAEAAESAAKAAAAAAQAAAKATAQAAQALANSAADELNKRL